MKNLTIPCPFCDVDNRLTVFQAERATLFQVKCSGCAREFEIDAEGRIMNLGIQGYSDLLEERQNTARPIAGRPEEGISGAHPETRMAREIRELEEEIIQAEKDEIDRTKQAGVEPSKKLKIDRTGSDETSKPKKRLVNGREVNGPADERESGEKRGSRPGSTGKIVNPPLREPPKKKGDGPSIVPIVPRNGSRKPGKKKGPMSRDETDGTSRGSGSGHDPGPSLKDSTKSRPPPEIIKKNNEHSPTVPKKVTGLQRREIGRREVKGSGTKPEPAVQMDDLMKKMGEEANPKSPHDPLLRPTTIPFPFPYTLQIAKPPFLKNPEMVWKLLITSAILGIITILLFVISINNWLDGSVEDIGVEGTVTSIDGMVIPNATVTIIGNYPNVTTDENGRYSISDVTSGTHTFRIGAEGYYTIYYKTTILSGSMMAQSDVTRDFELTKMENGTHQPDNIDDSNENGLYLYPTLFMINAVITFLGGLAARKYKNWKFCVVASIFGMFSFGLIFVSAILSIPALVILLRTRDSFPD
jgi:hypothetical protein